MVYFNVFSCIHKVCFLFLEIPASRHISLLWLQSQSDSQLFTKTTALIVVVNFLSIYTILFFVLHFAPAALVAPLFCYLLLSSIRHSKLFSGFLAKLFRFGLCYFLSLLWLAPLCLSSQPVCA